MIFSATASGETLMIAPCDDGNDFIATLAAEMPSDGPIIGDGYVTDWKAGERLATTLFMLYCEAFGDMDGAVDMDDAGSFVRLGLQSVPAWIAFMTTVLETDRAGPFSLTLGARMVVMTYDGFLMHTALHENGTELANVGYVASPVLLNWHYSNGPDELADIRNVSVKAVV